jgi:hypothetical protein
MREPKRRKIPFIIKETNTNKTTGGNKNQPMKEIPALPGTLAHGRHCRWRNHSQMKRYRIRRKENQSGEKYFINSMI